MQGRGRDGSAATVALVAAACGGGDDGGAGAQEATVQMTAAVKFQPAEIRVEAGRPVRLTVENDESTSVHTFTVAEMPVMDVVSSGDTEELGVATEYDLHIALAAGDVGTLEFTPTQSGEYVFICIIPGHEQAGMRGKLIVE